MRNKDIINLLKIQAKNVILDDFFINHDNNTLDCYISKKISTTSCPSCNSLTSRIHDHRIQKIKHSPINGYKTTLFLKKTRLFCPHCGKKFYFNYNDIVNPRFRCSNQLFNNIISDLQFTSMTFDEVAKSNFVSHGVVTRYLNYFSFLMQWNNIHSLPKHIGIDEFKGNCNGSKYLFHIYNLDTRETIYILKTRKFSDIVSFFDSIDNRNEVKLVTMDLCDSFKNAIQAKLKNAIVVADRFHYTRIVAQAMDNLRLQIWRNSKGVEKKYFKHLKRKLLIDPEKIDKDSLLDFENCLNYAFDLSGELKYGYQLYQSFLKIKEGSTYQEKCKRFKDWISDAQSSTIKEFDSASQTLMKWHKEILNSFKTNYTNSSTEGKNNKIKVIKRIAFGFRNIDNLRNRIKIRDLKV